jgi:hypothetical protein
MRRSGFLALLALPLLSACMMGDNLPEQPRRVVFFTDTSAQLDGAALQASGVAPSRISVAGLGEVTLAGGPTGSRRVEIQVGT